MQIILSIETNSFGDLICILGNDDDSTETLIYYEGNHYELDIELKARGVICV